MRHTHKLAAKYYGPYEVLEKIGPVAYKLALPNTSKVHPVFHMSLLKRARGPLPQPTELPEHYTADSPPIPVAILDRQMVRRGRVAATKVLVHWSGTSPADATWEFLQDLRLRFPHIDLVGKVSKGWENC